MRFYDEEEAMGGGGGGGEGSGESRGGGKNDAGYQDFSICPRLPLFL